MFPIAEKDKSPDILSLHLKGPCPDDLHRQSGPTVLPKCDHRRLKFTEEHLMLLVLTIG